MSQETQEREYAVHWEARVIGTYGVYAESEEEAIEKPKANAIPHREGVDHRGELKVELVEDYSGK